MPNKLNRAWISLGSNLGDRERNFAGAVAGLEGAEGVHAVRGSCVYETPPMGPPGQGRYWNAVVEVEAGFAPELLLDLCQKIEVRLGRVRREKWGPRVIDLDVLFVEGVEIHSPDLTVPHPGITQRAFVLKPLADVAPGIEIEGRRIIEWLERTSCRGIQKVKESVLLCR